MSQIEKRKKPYAYFDTHLTQEEFQEYSDLKKDLKKQYFFKPLAHKKDRIDPALKFTVKDFGPLKDMTEAQKDEWREHTDILAIGSYDPDQLLTDKPIEKLTGRLKHYEKIFESSSWKRQLRNIQKKYSVEEWELKAYQAEYTIKLNRYRELSKYYGYEELLEQLKKARKEAGYHVKTNQELLEDTLKQISLLPPGYQRDYLIRSVKNWDHSKDYYPLKECQEAMNILYKLNRFYGYTLTPDQELAIRVGIRIDQAKLHSDSPDQEIEDALDIYLEGDI